jgi:hypothetical protein
MRSGCPVGSYTDSYDIPAHRDCAEPAGWRARAAATGASTEESARCRPETLMLRASRGFGARMRPLYRACQCLLSHRARRRLSPRLRGFSALVVVALGCSGTNITTVLNFVSARAPLAWFKAPERRPSCQPPCGSHWQRSTLLCWPRQPGGLLWVLRGTETQRATDTTLDSDEGAYVYGCSTRTLLMVEHSP